MESFRTGLRIARTFSTTTQSKFVRNEHQNHVLRHGYHRAHNLFSQDQSSPVQALIKNIFKPAKCKENNRSFTTGAPLNKDEAPCEIPKPPKPPCIMPKPITWPPCDKICMPCCRPKEICEKEGVKERTCSGPKYRIPAFSECNHAPLPVIRPRECYDWTRICPQDRIGMEAKKPFTTVRERTDKILGRKPKDDACKRRFSTSARVFKDDEKECKKVKTGLPCVKPSEIIGGKKPTKSNKACEKICMPCCAPARDPPECFTPFVRPECIKHKPPRPAYSECKKTIYKKQPCECEVPRPPPCDKK